MSVRDGCEIHIAGRAAGGELCALALAQAGFAFVVTDPHFVIAHVNEAFTQLTGYEAREALGKSIDLLRCGDYDDAFYEGIRQHLAAGENWSDRIAVRKKDGGRFRSRSAASPIRDAAGQIAGYSFFSHDTSDEARMEAQLGHLQKMEAIGEMAAGIAHEINTPIQYVGDNIQFLRSAALDIMRLLEASAAACEAGRTAPIPENRLADLEALRREIDWDFLREEIPLALEQALEGRDRVAAIVRAMKEFAHPGDEELSPVDVNRAIENTMAVSRGEWKHVAEVQLDLAADLPPVPCFPGLFNQVLLNLVVNASHAIGDGREARGGEKGIITVSSAARKNVVEIVIGDNGCGIPPENLSRIFEPFFTTKDVGRGTGQGLALTHALIVDRMKGQIEVDSQVGRGTRFVLRLPLDEPVEESNTQEWKKPK